MDLRTTGMEFASEMVIKATQLHDPAAVVRLEKELKRNIQETGSSSAYGLLGYLYNHTGRHREALEAFSHIKDHPERTGFLPFAYSGMGYAYSRLGAADLSIAYYRKSNALFPDASVLYNIALVYLEKSEKTEAAMYLLKAIDLDHKLLPAYPLLISTYESIGRQAEAREISARYEKIRKEVTE